MENEKKWMVGYGLNNENKKVTTVRMIAMPEFGEAGQYTEEEAREVVEFIQKQPLPEFAAGFNPYHSDEWDEFVRVNTKKIKQLMDAKKNTLKKGEKQLSEKDLIQKREEDPGTDS